MQEINKPKFKKDQSVRLKPKEECYKIDNITAKELFEYLSENDLKSEQYIYGIKKANIFKNILYSVNFGERKVIHDIPEPFLEASEEDVNKNDIETGNTMLLEQVQNYIEKAPLNQVSDLLFDIMGKAMIKYPNDITVALQFSKDKNAKRYKAISGQRYLPYNKFTLFLEPAKPEFSGTSHENLWKIDKGLMKRIEKEEVQISLFKDELKDLNPYDIREAGYRDIKLIGIKDFYIECFKKVTCDADRIEYLRHITSIARTGYQDYSECHPTMDEISRIQTETYRKKNADYGDSFKKSMDEDGILVAKIRIGDKIRRIESLMSKGGEGQVKDERLQDTFLDLANYCVMTILWIKGRYE